MVRHGEAGAFLAQIGGCGDERLRAFITYSHDMPAAEVWHAAAITPSGGEGGRALWPGREN